MKSTPVYDELLRLVMIARTSSSVTSFILKVHCLLAMDSFSLASGSMSATGMEALRVFTLLIKYLFSVVASTEGELMYLPSLSSLVGGPELSHPIMPFTDFHNVVGLLSTLLNLAFSHIYLSNLWADTH